MKSEGFREVDIIVVDNGEFYKNKRVSLGRLLADLPQKKFKLLISHTNKGFGPACNQAVRETSKKNLLFLNPDCLITEKDIKKLVKILNSSDKIGIVAPQLFNKNSREQRWSFADKPDVWSKIFSRRKNTVNQRFLTSDATNVEWVSGACLMIKREIFLKVKGFDPNFFFYFEDRDLCLKVKDAGYQVMHYHIAKAIHLESQSLIGWGQRKKYYYRSQNYFFKKHYGSLATCLMKILRIPYYVKNVYLSK